MNQLLAATTSFFSHFFIYFLYMENIGIDDAKPQDISQIVTIFQTARAGMTYLSHIHTPEEDLAYFTKVVH
jgi:hypothetical protein